MRPLAGARRRWDAAEPSSYGPSDPVVRVAFVLLLGYLVVGRAFAQIGLVSVGLFVGEMAFVALVVYAPTRAALLAGFSWLYRPGPLHLVCWAMLAFLAFGVFQLGRGIQLGYSPVEAGKNFAFNYYPLLLLAGLAIGTIDNRFLDRLNKWLPWVNAFYVITFMLVLRGAGLRIPFSGVEQLTVGLATPVSIALMVARDRPVTRRWYLLGLNAFCLLFLQVRAEWLGVTLALAAWAMMSGRWLSLAKAFAALLFALSAVSYLDVQIPGAPTRGGGVSIQEIGARLVAPFNPELAASYSDDAEYFSGTTSWRREWWRLISEEVHSSQETEILGMAYGYPIADVAPFLRGAEVPIRTPHNVFYYALGFTGWLGVTFFAALLVAVGLAIRRVWHLTGDPFGVMVFVAGTAASFFENFYETPYNAAPFWFLIGVVLAPLVARQLGPVIRGAQPSRTRAVPRAVAADG